MCGTGRWVDWTQFAPRAHYTNSDTLSSYFGTMMWFGQIDLRIDQPSEDPANPGLRELGVAAVLTLSLAEAGLMDEWLELDGMPTPFMGTADSLTPPQLLEILHAAGITKLADLYAPEVLPALLAKIQTGHAGVQQITGHPIKAPINERKLVLPRFFTFFGQHFTPESWALSRTVFDRIWRENTGASGPPMVRVLRRLPSALDINFAVMGNDTPAGLLSSRMTTTTGGVQYRDGLDYSRELVALRQVFDAQPPASWEGTLYLHNLAALRTLSAPLPGSVPEALRTEAWKWKTVHTQMAGWTELRHDNLLYAKQSYTPPVMCEYPAGYVEPRPAFFAAMKRLMDFARTTVASLPVTGTWTGRPMPNQTPAHITVDRAIRKSQWLAQFDSMSSSLAGLQALAEAEVNRVPFTPEQTSFVRSMVQAENDYSDSSVGRTYSGWYPRMHLKSVFAGNNDPHPSEMWDPLVADIYTDAPDPVLTGDPGAVLYNATGSAALMLVVIDVNGRKCVHGGPVFTYYEFNRPFGEARLNDQAWRAMVRAKQQPAHPEWTIPFLVPGPLTIPEYTK